MIAHLCVDDTVYLHLFFGSFRWTCVRLKKTRKKNMREKRDNRRALLAAVLQDRAYLLLSDCKIVFPEHTVKHRVAVQQVRQVRLFHWRFGVKNDNYTVQPLIVTITPEYPN